MAAFIPLNAGGSDAFFFMMARFWWPLCRRHCHIFRDSSSCHVKQQHPGLLILLELSGEGWQPLCAPSLALLMWTLRQISTECHRWIFVELTLPAVCDEQTGSADPLGVAQFPSRAPGVRGPGGGCRRGLPRWGPRRNVEKGDVVILSRSARRNVSVRDHSGRHGRCRSENQ